jgi:short-subunit dehydrogenase
MSKPLRAGSSMQLSDCRVILTGASGGIGIALAQQLCAGGARVLAVCRRRDGLTDLLRAFPQQMCFVAADLREPRDRQAVVDAARSFSFSGVNTLINAAGVNRFALFEDLGEEEIGDLIGLNVTATLQLTRAVLPLLRAQPRALIVNVGSTYGSIGHAGYAAYCASKFALRGFSQALRRELADTGVHVLYVAPRATRTAMNSDAAMALNATLNVAVDSPDRVARAVLEAVQRDVNDLYLGWPEKFFVRLNSVLPGVVDRALNKKLPLIRHFMTHEEKPLQ